MRQFVAAAKAALSANLRAMTPAARTCLGLVVLSSFFAFAACGDDDDDGVGGAGKGAAAGETSEAGAPSRGGAGQGGSASLPEAGAGGAVHGEGSLVCQVLGELCHAADEGSGPAHDCHEVGHVGNAAACEAEFDGCIGTCTDANIGSGGAGTGDDAKCAALGSLCHDAGEIDEDAKECHELGHVGNAATCAASFESCARLCLAILDTIEGGGEGGAHAGGASSGGAASGGAGGAQ
jgi:hypothetical protein